MDNNPVCLANIGKIIVSPNAKDSDFFDVWTVINYQGRPWSKFLFTIYCDDRELIGLPLTEGDAIFEAPRWVEIGDIEDAQ